MKTLLSLAIVALLAFSAIPARAFTIEGAFDTAQFEFHFPADGDNWLAPYGVAAVTVSDGTPLVHGLIAWDHMNCGTNRPLPPLHGYQPLEGERDVYDATIVIYDVTAGYYLGIMKTDPAHTSGYEQVTLVPQDAPVALNQPGDVIEALAVSLGCKNGHVAFTAMP